jgi:energy-coupling factor transporter ATP-binding protein EcfA2
MWVESITLSNIKCFQEQEIRFTRNPNARRQRAKPYNWITLLGENGVGKSTILQALALLLAGPEAAKELLPRPAGWVRDPQSLGKLKAILHKENIDTGIFGEDRIRKSFSLSYFVTGSAAVEVGTVKDKSQTYTEPALVEESTKILSWLRANAFASGSKGWFAVGYGAFRRLTRLSQVIIPSLEQPKRSSNFISQFNEDNSLSSFERWMVYLDYRLAKDSNDIKAQKMKQVGEAAIIKLLPGDVKITGVTTEGLIEFLVDDQRIPTISLSDGFRSVIALAGDLIWRLLQSFPDLDDPTQASGVVLIDELDIHLHPSWQREIAGWLQQVFPNLQFFVATHSPLVAAGAGQDALTLRLEMVDNQLKILEIPYQDLAADIDRTLRSPAFGLESTYSPPTEKKIQRYHQLKRKNRSLAGEEMQEYEQLQLFMKDVQPFGERPAPDSLEARIDTLLEDRLP